MRSDCQPDLQRYGATAIEGTGHQIYPVPVRSWRAPSHVQTMYVIMGWLAYCGNPAIYTYTDYMVDSIGRGDPQAEQLGAPVFQPDER